MAFETSGALDERDPFAYSRNDIISSTQPHGPCAVGKASISWAKIFNFSSLGRKKKILRLSIGQFERNFSSLEMAHFFISFFFCRTFSVAPYLQYAPAIPVCSILQPCDQQGKNLNAAVSLIHGTPEHARTTLAAYWMQRDGRRDRRSTKRLIICPNGGAERPVQRQADY